MNNYQKAFDEIQQILAENGIGLCETNPLFELVDRATPKKPKEIITTNNSSANDLNKTTYSKYFGDCPICGKIIVDGFNYCLYCGQSIDWSEDE